MSCLCCWVLPHPSTHQCMQQGNCHLPLKSEAPGWLGPAATIHVDPSALSGRSRAGSRGMGSGTSTYEAGKNPRSCANGTTSAVQCAAAGSSRTYLRRRHHQSQVTKAVADAQLKKELGMIPQITRMARCPKPDMMQCVHKVLPGHGR